MAAAKALAYAISKRDGLKVKVQWIETSVIGTAGPMTEIKINEYLVLIEQHLEKLDEQFEVIHGTADPADIDGHSKEYNDLMDKIMRIKFELKDAKEKLPSSATPPPTSSTKPVSDIRLPRIDLPTFDGTLTEWMSFRDMFATAIHDNKSLSKAQKLTYLKTRLVGEAARQVRSLTLTDSNYDIAWAQLHERYQNERELLFSILRRFVTQSNVMPNSASSLRALIDVSKECIRSLEVLKRPVDKWDDIILYHIFQKIDNQSKELWEQSLTDSSIPPLKSLLDFLESRSRGLAASGNNFKPNHNPNPNPNQNGHNDRIFHKRPAQVHHTQTNPQACIVCSDSQHAIFRCPKFLEMSVSQREDIVKKNRLCFNCLKEGHSSSRCPSTGTCRTCNNKHNTLLHKCKEQTQQQSSQNADGFVLNHHSHDLNSIQQTLLATAVISIQDNFGRRQLCRALLDNGSTASFITDGCLNRLGLAYKKVRAQVVGLSSASVGTTKGIAQVTFTPHFNDESINMNALVLPKITGKLPSYQCDPTIWPHLHGLELADPSFHIPADIDVLIGADVFWLLLREGKKQHTTNAPMAFRSILGWLIAGGIDSGAMTEIKVHHADVDLDQSLRQFWEIESTPTTIPTTKEERLAESHFASTHKRDYNGKFTVTLPFKSLQSPIGSSRDMAMRRFLQLERRLKLNKDNKRNDYIKFMDEYLSLGHMERIPENEIYNAKNPVNYIPHHYVLKEESTTTKFRVVFDASAKTSSGKSMNDALMVGPVLQDTIMDILTRFRRHQVAFTADIAKMYRQILVTKQDSDMQRIFWRNDESETLKEYRLLTVTYGTASAPYLATKTLQQLAVDHQSLFPLGSKVAMEDFYVDDVMSGASTIEKACEIQSQLLNLMEKGGFDLRKWSSNSESLLETLPVDKRETSTVLQLDTDKTVKALGIYWNTTQDYFHFKVSLPDIQTDKLTKRKILSDVAKLFDPQGWLAPVIISAKILIQDLWKLKMSWDDEVPVVVQQQWLQMKADLKLIEQIQIPRCIVPVSAVSYSLIGFSDASEKAYSAVVYLCSTSGDSQVHTSLISSKTRVAPIKQLSLPRLELCGAVLLANLMENIQTCLKLNINELRAYSDSEIVLAWLRSPPTRWKTFVANKVSEVQEAVPNCVWSHVSGVDNPADCASRGIPPQELIQHPLWWTGPSWLTSREFRNPIVQLLDTVLEEKAIKIQCNLVTNDHSLLHKYSKLSKLTRVTAWIFRFIRNVQVKIQNRDKTYPAKEILKGPLSPEEIDHSLIHWVSEVQQQSFSQEIQNLMKGIELKSKSPLLTLSPFLDEIGLLRVGGRLKNAPIPINQKHPMLLPRHHRLTELIIMNEHFKFFHAGPQLLMSILNQRFWIIRGRDAIRHQIRKCVTCTRHSAAVQHQIMGNLPSSRVTPVRAFHECGVDYAGPFQLRTMAKRSKVTLKAYFAIFICFTTRPIHLEVVSSWDTSSILPALRKRIAKR